MLNKSAHGIKRILIKPRVGAKASDDKPRAAPARPKPLDFPRYQVQGDLNAVHQYAQDFSRLFVDLEKNVSPKIVEALNISVLGEVPLDRLVPSGYLPPKEWLQDPLTVTDTPATDQSVKKLSNGMPTPSHRDFYARAKELHYPTDEALNSISGPRNPGKGSSTQPPLRLSHTHKFFQHLLLMAEYWDASKDNYMTEGDKETYTGRRYGASHEMPPEYRDDTISAFLELSIWPFRCNIQSPRATVSRKVLFQNHRYLPIQGVTSAVCRNTTDRQKARRSILEGPLMGIHCRNTATFRKEDEEAIGRGKEEIMDLLFEVGGAVLVAQKRAREGKMEEPPWENKFWVKKGRRHLGEVGGGRQDRETDERARREMD
ncbi:MAG: hypothetical protein Q9225_007187, partial [Loekoesia sp. 1 TL-2023]